MSLAESAETQAAPNGKHKNIGYFDDEIAPLKAEFICLWRNKAANKYHREFADPNFAQSKYPNANYSM